MSVFPAHGQVLHDLTQPSLNTGAKLSEEKGEPHFHGAEGGIYVIPVFARVPGGGFALRSTGPIFSIGSRTTDSRG